MAKKNVNVLTYPLGEGVDAIYDVRTKKDGTRYVIITDLEVEKKVRIGIITIPDKIDDIPVTMLGPNSFMQLKKHKTEIVFPKYLEVIAAKCFSHCDNIYFSSLPKTLLAIEEEAFNLDTIRKIDIFSLIPRNITLFDISAPHTFNKKFDECDINYITDPFGHFSFNIITSAELTKIKESGYYTEINNVSYFVYNDKAYLLGANAAFKEKNVVIPDTIKFSSKEVNVVAIMPFAFASNDHIETVIVGNNVEVIGHDAFANSENLAYLEIGRNVNYIGEAFVDNTMIFSIYVPINCKNVPTINGDLDQIYLGNVMNDYYLECDTNIVNRVIAKSYDYDNNKVDLIIRKDNSKSQPHFERIHYGVKKENVYFSNGLFVIKHKSFTTLLKMLSSTIKYGEDLVVPSFISTPEGKIEINAVGSAAIYFNDSINYIVIPPSIEKIDNIAFAIKDILNIRFIEKSHVKYIGSYAFSCFFSETNIHFPDSVEYIGSHVIFSYHKTNLFEEVSFGKDSQLRELEGSAFDLKCYSLVLPPSLMVMGNNAIPSSVENISFLEGEMEMRFIDSGERMDSFPNNFATHLNDGYYIGNKTNPYAILCQMDEAHKLIPNVHEGTKLILKHSFSYKAKGRVVFPNSVRYCLSNNMLSNNLVVKLNEGIIYSYDIKEDPPLSLKAFALTFHNGINLVNDNIYSLGSFISSGSYTLNVSDSVKLLDLSFSVLRATFESLPENINYVRFDNNVKYEFYKFTQYKNCLYYGSINNPYYILVDASKSDDVLFVHPDCIAIANKAAFKNSDIHEVIFEGDKVRFIGSEIFNHYVEEITLPSKLNFLGVNKMIGHFNSYRKIEDITCRYDCEYLFTYAYKGVGGTFGKTTIIDHPIVVEPKVEEEKEIKAPVKEEVKSKKEIKNTEIKEIDLETAKETYEMFLKVDPSFLGAKKFETLTDYQKYMLSKDTVDYQFKEVDGATLIYSLPYKEVDNVIILHAIRNINKDTVHLPREIIEDYEVVVREDIFVGPFIRPEDSIKTLVLHKMFTEMDTLHMYTLTGKKVNIIRFAKDCYLSPATILNYRFKSGYEIEKPHNLFDINEHGSILSKDHKTVFYLGEGDILGKEVERFYPYEIVNKAKIIVPDTLKEISYPTGFYSYLSRDVVFDKVINLEVITSPVVKVVSKNSNLKITSEKRLLDTEFILDIYFGAKLRKITSNAFVFPSFEDRLFHQIPTILLHIDKSNPYLVVKDNAIYSRDLKVLYVYFGLRDTKITLPDELEIIKEDAFKYCPTEIEEITCGSNLEEIGHGAFITLTSLKAIHLDSEVSLYEDSVPSLDVLIDDSYDLVDYDLDPVIDGPIPYQRDEKAYVIPQGVEEVKGIRSHQSSPVTNQKPINVTLSLPPSLERMSFDALRYLRGIKKITIKDNDNFIVKKSALLSSDGKILYRYFDMSNKGEYVVPDTVEVISPRAFYETNLSKIVMNDNVRYIGNAAFAYADKLKEINLSSSLDYLGQGAFLTCPSLEEIFIPYTKIFASRIFYDCSSLVRVTFDNRNRVLTSGMFINCFKLKEINLPNQLLYLDIGINSAQTLVNEDKMSLNIPSSVKDIGIRREGTPAVDYIFSSDSPYYYKDNAIFKKEDDTLLYCLASNTKEYTVPEYTKGIDRNAFRLSPSLEKIIFKNDQVFKNENEFRSKIHVFSTLKTVYIPRKSESLIDEILSTDPRIRFNKQTLMGAKTFLNDTGFLKINETEDNISASFIYKNHKAGQAAKACTISVSLYENNVVSACSCGGANKECIHSAAIFLYEQKKHKTTFSNDLKSLILKWSVPKLMSKGSPDITMSRSRLIIEGRNEPFSSIKITPKLVEAKIGGSEGEYTIKLFVEDNMLNYDCSCPFDNLKKGACKHIGALMLYLQAHPELFDK